ncbi:iron complex outermembrane recepter protein [Lutibacter agarilyticus]|uniref:Iron complex outermembrane recepter protein n=1 Tax=Lutibacter agarilyticus TaxID=1109740 RepID=A0A238X3V6_9FLAO|nr:TonB-dependent receptor [Lutibacter agarilyticus]SNR53370.1 iron complex outermembrane recepter protein [Lutibacter agarilyticus]
MKNFRIFLFNVILLVPALMFAQQTVSGTVTESEGNGGLPGVGIIIKGSTMGTTTDFDGHYTINNVKVGDVLIFSYMGFNTQEVTVGSSTTINVVLQEDSQALDEVVIIGYGTTTVKDATGSVTSVKAEDLNKGAIVTADQMLTGKVAGVTVVSQGGAPGAGSTIRIRGGSSLTASNNPLFVIDGVPVDGGNIDGISNPLSTINPNDIASYTILKDASATAIYGSRASNGVIIITTKKGTSDGFKATYTGNVSVSQNIRTVDALSTQQFRDYITTNGTASDIALLGDASTDWQDELFQLGVGTDHNLSLQGGNEHYNLRGSMGYTNQTGTIKTSRFERATYAIGGNTKLLDEHLKIDLNANLALVNNRFADTGAISSAISMDPTKPVYDSSSPYGGYWQWLQTNGNPIAVGAPKNPVALLKQRDNSAYATRSIGNIQFDYKMHFLPELRANLNLGYDVSSSDGHDNTYNSATASNVELAKLGNERTYEQSKTNLLWDFYLNYATDLESIDSSLDVMAGYSYQNFENKGSSVSDIQDPTITQFFDFYNVLNLQSFFGRLKYGFADKYLLTLTYRRDGSSRFVGDNKWGNFPSAAFAWKIYEEDFMSGSETVTNLKLRLSWGITGQQDIGPYYPAIAQYLGSTETAQYQFGDSFINTYRAEPFNTTLKWEETTTYNLGIDFGLWDDLLTGSVDTYYRETKDLLNFIPFPGGSSLSNAGNANIGTMVNKGVELSLNVNPIRKDDLNLDIAFNATYNDTEITKLTTNNDPNYEGVETGGFSGGVGNTIQRHTVGYAPSSFFVYEQVYDENNKPIEGVYVDRNNDGEITIADKYRYKNPASYLTFGLAANLDYKNWNFTMAWRANVGNYVYNNIDSNLGYGLQLLNSAFPEVISNGVENVLESGFVNGGAERYLSDYYIQDASFIKLDNINISYRFNNPNDKKANASLSLSGQNLWTITDYTGLDPEVGSGIDYNIYPRPITFMLGLNLTF